MCVRLLCASSGDSDRGGGRTRRTEDEDEDKKEEREREREKLKFCLSLRNAKGTGRRAGGLDLGRKISEQAFSRGTFVNTSFGALHVDPQEGEMCGQPIKVLVLLAGDRLWGGDQNRRGQDGL